MSNLKEFAQRLDAPPNKSLEACGGGASHNQFGPAMSE